MLIWKRGKKGGSMVSSTIDTSRLTVAHSLEDDFGVDPSAETTE